jgi:hypothetical protein
LNSDRQPQNILEFQKKSKFQEPMVMKNNNYQNIWVELTDSQSEHVSGGTMLKKHSFLYKFVDKNNGAITIASGNEIGILNLDGAAICQTNIA